MSYSAPVYTDVGGNLTSGYTIPVYTDAGGDLIESNSLYLEIPWNLSSSISTEIFAIDNEQFRAVWDLSGSLGINILSIESLQLDIPVTLNFGFNAEAEISDVPSISAKIILLG